MATDVDGLHVQYKSKIHLVHITMTSFRRLGTGDRVVHIAVWRRKTGRNQRSGCVEAKLGEGQRRIIGIVEQGAG